AVESGFVAGLARPGANISGFQNFEPAMGGKWLGVLKEAAPNMRRAAVLFGSDSRATIALLRAAEAAAPALAVDVTPGDVHAGVEIERAIAAVAGQPNGGLIVTSHPRFVPNRGLILLLEARHRLRAVYPFRYYTTEGGLMSYGPDQIDQWRGAASYVDRILRGEKPSHGRGYYDRIGLGEACFSGARGRCRGSDGCAQAASACAGSGVLQSTAALSGWPGGVRDGALLGAGVARAWPRGATDAGAIREGVHQAQQARCRGCGSDLRGGSAPDDALCAGQDGRPTSCRAAAPWPGAAGTPAHGSGERFARASGRVRRDR